MGAGDETQGSQLCEEASWDGPQGTSGSFLRKADTPDHGIHVCASKAKTQETHY